MCLCKYNMTNFAILYVFIITFLHLLIIHLLETDGSTLGNGPLPFMALNYLLGSAVNVPMDLLNPPQNRNDSVGYRVYTKKNPDQPCFLEPTLEALSRCKIDPDDPLILLVSGFIEILKPGNLFEVMKDRILERGPYTVIIMDWTKYNGPPYSLAVENMKLIGLLGGEMLNFLIKHVGVKAENMRLTGHSLGGHLVGYMGRHVPNLGSIDSLDPAGPFFATPPFKPKLTPSDANFVRVMHSSNLHTGLGLTEPLGHIDFYVNGGGLQPHCRYGARYKRTSGDIVTVNSLVLKHICPHELINNYYIDTITTTDCKFLATKCNSYRDFKNGKCPPKHSLVADMDFYGQNKNHFPPKSKFYLRTRRNSPYCLKNGYKSIRTKG